MWGPCLHEEVVHLFIDAQRPQQERIQVWLWRRYQSRLAKRRETYDAHRYFRDEWYEQQLAIHRESSRLRAASRVPSYVAWQKEKAKRNADARARRIAGRTCPECGNPVPMRSTTGTTPKFCSELCNRRAAGRAWYHRNKEREKIKQRERYWANPEKSRARTRNWWRAKKHARGR